MAALVRSIHHDAIPGPSVRAVELACSRPLSPAFEAWFARCVVRDPGARFAHAREAGQALLDVHLDWPARAQAWRADGATSAPPGGATRPQPVSIRAGSEKEVVPGGARTSSALSSLPTRPGRPRHAAVVFVIAAGLSGLAAAAFMLRGVPNAPSTAASSVAGAVKKLSGAPALAAIPADMVPIQAGSIRLGEAAGVDAPAPNPPQAVSAFAIDRYEVTVERYRACITRGACSASGFRADTEASAPAPNFEELCNARHPARDQHPINCVDREQARRFCAWLGRRLPSEAEWEFATRGSDGRLYPWGNDQPGSCEVAVVSGLCARKPEATRRVGSRQASSLSPFGVADLSGNVWEWVDDDSPAPEHAPAEPGQARKASGVLRGGGWDYPPEKASALARLVVPPERADVSSGFRCALTVPSDRF